MDTGFIILPKIKYIENNEFHQKALAIQENIKEWIEDHKTHYNTTPSIRILKDTIHILQSKTNFCERRETKENNIISSTNIDMPSLIGKINIHLYPQVKPQQDIYKLGILTQIETRLRYNTLILFEEYLDKTNLKKIYTSKESEPSIFIRDEDLITTEITKNFPSKSTLDKKLKINEQKTNNTILHFYYFMGIKQNTSKEIKMNLSNIKYYNPYE